MHPTTKGQDAAMDIPVELATLNKKKQKIAAASKCFSSIRPDRGVRGVSKASVTLKDLLKDNFIQRNDKLKLTVGDPAQSILKAKVLGYALSFRWSFAGSDWSY
jgi:hypothetical protein